MQQPNRTEHMITLCDQYSHELRIVDLTNATRPYKAWKYVRRFLKMADDQDLKGLGSVVLYDDSDIIADSIPGTYRASYSAPKSDADRGSIHIYLNWSLGILPFLPRPTGIGWWNVLRNRLYIALFGKAELAKVLFHEVGHHYFETLLKRQYRDEEEAEKDAGDYMRRHYRKAFPRAMYWHHLMHILVMEIIYGGDSDNMRELWMSYLSERDYRTVDLAVPDYFFSAYLEP